MLRRVDCASWSRVLASAVALAVLGACSAPREHPLGRVELITAGACDGALGGQLRLEGSVTTVIAGRELCQGPLVRELPPGSYRLSWQDRVASNELPTTPPPLQKPTLLGVLAGRSTLVRLTLEVAPAAGSATACSDAADHAGPS